MKNSIKGLVLLVVISSVYSCSTSNEFSVMKRRYNKGYYVDFSGKEAESETKVSVDNREESSANSNVQASLNSKEEGGGVEQNLTSSILPKADNYPLAASADNNIHKSSASDQPDEASKKTSKAQGIKSKIIAKKLNKVITRIYKPAGKKSSSDDDIMLIVEVVLCFFWILNLISVFLKDGQSITANFWVTLLLDLLFWIPGLIFSLLVVLDVINLA